MYGRLKRKRSSKGYRPTKRRRTTSKGGSWSGASYSQRLLSGAWKQRLLPDPGQRGPPGGSTRTVTRVQKSLTLFPDRLQTPMKFNLKVLVDIVAGVGGQISLKANSIEDPGGSASAAHAIGYDTLTTLYQTYVVTASSIKIQTILGQAGSGSLLNQV